MGDIHPTSRGGIEDRVKSKSDGGRLDSRREGLNSNDLVGNGIRGGVVDAHTPSVFLDEEESSIRGKGQVGDESQAGMEGLDHEFGIFGRDEILSRTRLKQTDENTHSHDEQMEPSQNQNKTPSK